MLRWSLVRLMVSPVRRLLRLSRTASRFSVKIKDVFFFFEVSIDLYTDNMNEIQYWLSSLYTESDIYAINNPPKNKI